MGDHAAGRLSSVLRRWRVRRSRNGRIQLNLPDHEREVVRRMLPQLRELLTLGAEDDRTRRLFPTAFQASTEVIAFMNLQARSAFRAPRGIAQPLPLIIVIGPPLRFVKYFAVMFTGAPSARTL